MQNPEINSERQAVLDALYDENTPFVFLTGKAGTGKSTLLRYYIQQLQRKPVVLSPTGVAAVNIKGQTIHSFFKLPVRSFRLEDIFSVDRELFDSFDTLIIDEISMVRSDLMYVVDRALRMSGKMTKGLPFGGKKVLVVGDLCQLAPVIKREDALFKQFLQSANGAYFFDSPLIYNQTEMKTFELQTVFRQQDADFLQALNAIRYGERSASVLDYLNQRVESADEHIIRLCTRNEDVDQRNIEGFRQLNGKSYVFEADKEGSPPSDLIVPTQLEIKLGCRVMLCANVLNEGKPYFSNGELGEVQDIDLLRGIIHVKKDDGDEVEVRKYAYKNNAYEINKTSGELEQVEKGSLRQFPMKLAYAISIHKSQGVTLSRAHIDLGKGCFAHGQLYVALSRIKSYEGLSLERSIRPSDVIMDQRIKSFYL